MSRKQNSAVSFKENVDSFARLVSEMALLQTSMSEKVVESSEKDSTRQHKISALKVSFQDFHHIFQCFADECRNEWATVYK
jgi:hypothetical protein